MDVEIFALCDAATDSGGKLNMLGAFDRIYARQFPAVHAHCAIALRVRFERIEEGDHRVRINFVDTDGKNVIPGVDGNIGVNFPADVHAVCANMVLNINGMKFERPGQYSIDLAIDGRHERSLPVNVVQVEQKAQPGN
jgi:hypothetical protein